MRRVVDLLRGTTRSAPMLVLLAATAATLVGSPTTTPSENVDALIAQLGADDWSARQAAQERLAALGAPAVERLERAAKAATNDEVRQRAEAALAQIAQDQLVGPSPVTLHLHDATARDAFAELSRQAHTNLQPMPAELWDLKTWPAITLDVENKPFWEALRELCNASGVELRQWNEGLRLMQSAGAAAAAGAGGSPGWSNGRSAVCGAFLITLRQCTRTQTIEYAPGGNGAAADNRTSDFSIAMQATAEPKLRVLRTAYMAKLEEATDDAGNSLLVTDADSGATNDEAAEQQQQATDAAFVPGPGGTWQFSARLAYPRSRPLGKRLTVLRGGVNVLLQTRSQTVEIPNVLSQQPTTRTAGGLKLTLTSLKKSGERYELSATVTRDRAVLPHDSDWERVQQSLGDIRLLDEQGRALVGSNLSSGGGEDSVELTMSFARDENALSLVQAVPPPPAPVAAQPPGLVAVNPPAGGGVQPAAPAARNASTPEPAKLVWQVPIEVKEVTIPFEFKDVALPE